VVLIYDWKLKVQPYKGGNTRSLNIFRFVTFKAKEIIQMSPKAIHLETSYRTDFKKYARSGVG